MEKKNPESTEGQLFDGLPDPPPSSEKIMGVHLLQLTVEDFKRVELVELFPDGKSLIIGGKNSAGKSSALDAFCSLVRGAKGTPEVPIRMGKKKSRIVGRFTDGTVITKVLSTARAPRLDIKLPGDGKGPGGNQGWLTTLTGDKAFDLSKFVNATKEKQRKIALRCSRRAGTSEPLDFTGDDEEYDETFKARTVVNGQVKTAEAQFSRMPFHEDAVGLDKDSTVEAATAALVDGRLLVESRANLETILVRSKDAYAASVEEVERLKGRIQEEEGKQAKGKEFRADLVTKLDAAPPVPDFPALQERLSEAQRIERALAENALTIDARNALQALTKQAAQMTERLQELKSEKAQALETAEYPIPGMTFDEDGYLCVDNIPFPQWGEAQKYMAALGIANREIPKEGIRIAILRAGGGLDTSNLRRVFDEARAAGIQLLAEVPRIVGADVVITEGKVATPEEVAALRTEEAGELS